LISIQVFDIIIFTVFHRLLFRDVIASNNKSSSPNMGLWQEE